MGTRLESMNAAYDEFCKRAPEAYNPHLDKSQPNTEYLLHCPCRHQYRVWINGEGLPLKLDNIICPFCYRPAAEYTLAATHSAGCFNAVFAPLPKVTPVCSECMDDTEDFCNNPKCPNYPPPQMR